MSTTQTTPQTTTWNLDPVHSVAEFKVRHMMISSVKGHFTGLAGVLTLLAQTGLWARQRERTAKAGGL